MADVLFHERNLTRIPLFGGGLRQQMIRRIDETRNEARGKADPDVSVVIRSRNNARQLERLLRDIRRQDYAGSIEIIVVDTESEDDSVAVARKFDAKVVGITQSEFTYPKALNVGFAAARSPWIFSFVEHSSLASRYTFKVATRWNLETKVAAVWAFSLPNDNATIWEQLGYTLLMWGRLSRRAHVVSGREAKSPGMLAANNLLLRRSAWKDVGGFDEGYAAGGEDSALGRSLLSRGYQLVYDPALSAYHTHGLGFFSNLRQLLYWRRLARPLPFDLTNLQRFRKDL